MSFTLLPSHPDARREVEAVLQTASAIGVLLFAAAAVLMTIVMTPAQLTIGLAVVLPILGIGLVAYINSRLNYRLYSSDLQLLLGIVPIAVGSTIGVYLTGSTSSPTPVLYVILIVTTTIYTTARAGALALVVCVIGYAAVLLLEEARILPYAPYFPEKVSVFHIPKLTYQTFLVVTFINCSMYVLSVFIGRTLRKRREAMEQANRRLVALDEAKSRFLSIVSHDLRTPITSIKAMGGILEDEAGDISPDEARTYAGTIVSEADRLHRLVTDLLALDKMEAGEMEWNLTRQDVAPLVRNAADVFAGAAREKNIELKSNIRSDLPALDVDADRFSQLVSNLLSNAVKFTPPGGTVTVNVDKHEEDHIPCVQLIVHDTGPGIAPEDTAHIFDRYAQTRVGKERGEGTGLGLAIAREIVLAHSGTIGVDSTPGRGTHFTVTFPVTEAVAG